VTPLVYESVKAAAPSRSIPFDVPEGSSETKVRYRVTGHGGQIEEGAECRQPADEFCKREHTIAFDGGAKTALTPWRNDCRTLCTVKHYKGNGLDLDYCAENPCGAQASVRASRANWCPGSVTPPTEHLLEGSTKGRHTFDFSIAKIAPGVRGASRRRRSRTAETRRIASPKSTAGGASRHSRRCFSGGARRTATAGGRALGSGSTAAAGGAADAATGTSRHGTSRGLAGAGRRSRR
jgi:hypothetical protein